MATVTLTFEVTMPHNRVGTQLEVTKPDTTIALQMVPEDDLSADTYQFEYVISNPNDGDTYGFRIRTVCAVDGGGEPASMSGFSESIPYTYDIVCNPPTKFELVSTDIT